MKDVEKHIDNISNWLKEYLSTNKIKGLVIGLSGGIDSAVSLGIAIKAIGKNNVRCFTLPCTCYHEKEREEDEHDALLVADHFGIELQKIYLDKEATLLYKKSKYLIDSDHRLILPNIKARLRMITLRFLAEGLGYIVLGTTNKTEEYLGYYTKAGDGGSGVDIEPIADYFKYEIKELAKGLGVPDKIINKAPSAGLWYDQTDEGELGFSYDEIDKYLTIREEFTDENQINKYFNHSELMKIHPKIIFSKIKFDLIDKVEKMIVASNHKRYNPPFYKK